jgi:hypothetical protein
MSASDLLGQSGATFSDCGSYRYSLWRRWDYGSPAVLFVMLNPSTADGLADDPTIRRCIGFARRWGAGGVRVCNLYAWRATNPRDLPARDAVAEDAGLAIVNSNDSAILAAASDASRIIAAWGAHTGPLSTRRGQVMDLLTRRHVTTHARRVEALGVTKHGHPRHPLYVRGDVAPVSYGRMGATAS